MNLQPLSDRIIIARDEPAQKKGLIIVPDVAQEKPLEGKVLACGPGRLNDAGVLVPMAVKVGDRVLFGKYAGHDFKVDGEEVFLLREDDVVAIIKA